MSRHGHKVEASEITKIDSSRDGYAITWAGGLTLWVSKDECNGFVPKIGDAIVLFTKNFSTVTGIIIENQVIRYQTKKQQEQAHKDMVDGFRLKKLEQYVKHGEKLKKRVEKLPIPLRDRMHRFAKEDGIEFWIESASYEMAVMEGAAALLRKVTDLGFIYTPDVIRVDEDTDGAVDWINEWWDINSDKHDPPYDYKKQMEIVPDFGDGHSGFTASAARSIAIAVLNGEDV